MLIIAELIIVKMFINLRMTNVLQGDKNVLRLSCNVLQMSYTFFKNTINMGFFLCNTFVLQKIKINLLAKWCITFVLRLYYRADLCITNVLHH